MSKIIKQFRWNYQDGNGEYVNYPEEGWQISNNETEVLVPLNKTSTQQVLKLGIQAASGTRILINNEEFLISDFQVLELDCEGIDISSIKILGNKNAVQSEEESVNKANLGLAQMDQAISQRLNDTESTIAISNLGKGTNINDPTSTEITYVISADYSTNAAIENAFLTNYLKGYNTYLEGIRGVYTITTEPVTKVFNILINVVLNDNKGEE